MYIYKVVCKEHYENFRQVPKFVFRSHVLTITITGVDIKGRIRILLDIIKYAPISHNIFENYGINKYSYNSLIRGQLLIYAVASTTV